MFSARPAPLIPSRAIRSRGIRPKRFFPRVTTLRVLNRTVPVIMFAMSADQESAALPVLAQDSEQGWEAHGRDAFAYQMIMQRGLQTNSLLWQTPGLALTAQAFLLTVALGGDTVRPIRIVVSVLGLVIGIMSMQLMAKHHYYYELDQAELRRIETRLKLPPIAHRSQQIVDHARDVWALPFVKVTSYIVWQSGIFLVALTNVVVLTLVLSDAGFLK
jgi:hypothetical protein